jgi:teichuronic acid biosynthesis glycosyltransferase TuaH
MKTVFIPPIVDYNFLKQLPQQIADQFYKNGYRVIYCGIQDNMHMKREIKENFFVYSSGSFALQDIKDQRIKIDIMYNTWAKNHNYVDILNPTLNIYHSCDSFEQWKQYEPLMISKSDLIFCTSKFLYDIRKNQHDKVYLCRNGCNSEMIEKSEYEVLDKLKFVKHPIFCFAGAIGVWVSTYLLKKISDKYFTCFAGIEFGKDLPKNINTIGWLDHKRLIDFYYNCDFGLLPFNLKNEISKAANPIKLWEYLACGLPVLATSWEETELDIFKDVVYTADTEQGFLELSDSMALLNDKEICELKQECFNIARQNTWEKRFEIIQREIDRI